jgi:septum formation protein
MPPECCEEEVRHETTQVTVSQLTDAEIADYVASGEPMDKAGAYAIQGRASRWIPRIEGCYFNVVGLPLALVYRMLNAQSCESGPINTGLTRRG